MLLGLRAHTEHRRGLRLGEHRRGLRLGDPERQSSVSKERESWIPISSFLELTNAFAVTFYVQQKLWSPGMGLDPVGTCLCCLVAVETRGRGLIHKRPVVQLQ